MTYDEQVKPRDLFDLFGDLFGVVVVAVLVTLPD